MARMGPRGGDFHAGFMVLLSCRNWGTTGSSSLPFSFAFPLFTYFYNLDLVFIHTKPIWLSAVSADISFLSAVKSQWFSAGLGFSLPKTEWDGIVWTWWFPHWHGRTSAQWLQHNCSRSSKRQGGLMKTERGGEFCFDWVNLWVFSVQKSHTDVQEA